LSTSTKNGTALSIDCSLIECRIAIQLLIKISN
jgi:hypothetical protein